MKTRNNTAIERRRSSFSHKDKLYYPDLNLECLNSRQSTYLTEQWHSIKIESQLGLPQQVFLLAQHFSSLERTSSFFISERSLAKVMNLKKTNFQDNKKRGQNVDQKYTRAPSGRPKALSPEQESTLLAYLRTCDEENTSPSYKELLGWVNAEFSLTLTQDWLSAWVDRTEGLRKAIAEPMEQKRREVTEESLRSWGAQVEPHLRGIHPHLIFNMDETGDQPRAAPKTKQVLSFRSGRLTYKADRPGIVDFLTAIGGPSPYAQQSVFWATVCELLQ
jgi:hypothetical protein